MGKNRNTDNSLAQVELSGQRISRNNKILCIEQLIRFVVNTIVHQIVEKHTNRPESKNFLNSEIIEYRGKAEESAESHNWNEEDKKYLESESLKKIKEKLAMKYSDITYSDEEAVKKLRDLIKEII